MVLVMRVCLEVCDCCGGWWGSGLGWWVDGGWGWGVDFVGCRLGV